MKKKRITFKIKENLNQFIKHGETSLKPKDVADLLQRGLLKANAEGKLEVVSGSNAIIYKPSVITWKESFRKVLENPLAVETSKEYTTRAKLVHAGYLEPVTFKRTSKPVPEKEKDKFSDLLSKVTSKEELEALLESRKKYITVLTRNHAILVAKKQQFQLT